jgi:HSP20 family protein
MLSLWSASRVPSHVSDFLSVQRSLQQSLDEAFRGLPAAPTEAAAIPVKVDVREDDKAFYVSAELPGLSEKEVDLTFDDGLLTIRGEKKFERDETKDTWHVVERSYGSFARRLSLSASIDASTIEATFEKGVLTITLPKQPQDQTAGRKIEIKSH